ncbi:MAG: NAD-dependent epimerase/dehydratase family protein [Thermoanaerobaculia bacterium]
MKILVTGGTGVVGAAAVRSLLAAGHCVRLFSRHARRDAGRWQGSEVTAKEGSVADAAEVAGAAEGCDAVLHIAGIVEERPPRVTFEAVNVGGTRNLLAEAEVAGVKRFVHVSSLGADGGASAYHVSKRQAEELVRRFPGDWLILRPGNVYGPGDEVLSYLLQVVRAAPAVPVIDGGDQPFQPLHAEDLGAALAVAVTRTDLSRQVLLLAGPEVTTTQDVLDRLARLTGRDPVRLPVPGALAALGAQAASLLGVRVPLNDDKVTMLREGNVIPPGEVNALTRVLGVTPTPLDEGLRRLANTQPEQLQGTGTLTRRRYWAFLAGVQRTPRDLFAEFRRRFFELVPESTVTDAGEAAGQPELEPGSVLTLSLPFRGNVQVRIVEVTDTELTLVTVAGHPLAGSNTFRFAGTPGVDLRFEVETCDRSATLLDELAMVPFGGFLKRFTWTTVVEETARMAGARPPVEVQTEEHLLTGDEEKAAVADLEKRVGSLARQDERELQEEARSRLETVRI